MKKSIICFLLILCLLPFNLFADERIVPASSLPKKATIFLEQYFKDIPIVFVEAEWDEFEVNLDNNVEIKFLKNGNWEEIDGRYQAIPTGFIPKPILDTIQSMYTDVYIIKIEKDWFGFEIELSNRMALKINEKGKVHEVEHDD